MPPGAGFSQDERPVSASTHTEYDEPAASTTESSSTPWALGADGGGMEITVPAEGNEGNSGAEKQQQQQRSKENKHPNLFSGSVDGHHHQQQQQQHKQQPNDGAPTATEDSSGLGATEMDAGAAGGSQGGKKNNEDEDEANNISIISSKDSALAQEAATALDAELAGVCQEIVAGAEKGTTSEPEQQFSDDCALLQGGITALDENLQDTAADVAEKKKAPEPEQQLQVYNGPVATTTSSSNSSSSNNNNNISAYDKFQKEVESWNGTLPEQYHPAGANDEPNSNNGNDTTDNSNNDSDTTAEDSISIFDLYHLLQSDATVNGVLEDFCAGMDRGARVHEKYRRAREEYVRSNRQNKSTAPLALEACFRNSIKHKAMLSHVTDLGLETRDQLFPPARLEDGDEDAMVESVNSRIARLATFLEEGGTIRNTETFLSSSVGGWQE